MSTGKRGSSKDLETEGGTPAGKRPKQGGSRKTPNRSERRQEALREVRDLFETLASNMLDGLVVMDRDGTALYANRAAYRIVGLRPRKHTGGLTMAQFLLPDDLQRAQDNHMLAMDGKGGFLAQYRIVTPRNETRWIETVGQKTTFRGTEASLVTFRDITRRKHDEEALRTSEERLKLSEKKYAEAFRLSPLAISISDPGTGTVVDINEAYEALTGFSREELVGNRALSLVLWANPADRERYIKEMRSHRKVDRFQTTLRKKDGSLRDVVVSASVIRVGGVSHLQNIVHDVTDQKRAEEGLLLSEKKFSLAFHASPDAMAITERESGRFFDVNRAFEARTGYARDELLGRTPMELDLWLRSEDRDRFVAELDEKKELGMHETQLRTKDGRIRDILFSAGTIEIGNKAYILTLARDITARKRMEEALRQSEERYRRITSAITDYIYTVHLDGGNVVRTVHSPACEAVTGYRPEDFDQDPFLWYTMVEAEDRESVREHFNRVTTGERVNPIEHRIRRKDGSVRWVSNMPVIHRDASGTMISYDGVVSDITARKLAEQGLRESEERFRALHDASFGGIAIHDRGVVLDCNQGLSDLSGYSRDELIGVNGPGLIGLIVPASRDMVMRKILAGEETPYTADGLRKDGTVYPLEIRGKNVPYHGRTVRVAEFRDITELRRAESTLKINAERMQALLKINQMGDAPTREITDFALEEAVRLTRSTIGYLAFLNEDETVLTMYSWSKAAMHECRIADKPITYLVSATGLWGEAIRQRRPVITNDYGAPSPWKKGCPKGHVAVARHMNVPVFDGKRIVLVAGVGNKQEEYDESDIQQLTLLMEGMWRLVDRKKAEGALRESEEKFRSLATNLPGVVYQSYIRDNGDTGMYYVSERSREILGLDPDPKDFFQRGLKCVPPEKREEFIRSIMEAVETTSRWDFETLFTRPDGREVYFRGIAQPEQRENEVVYNGVLLDITDHRRTESALRESEERYRLMAELTGKLVYDLDVSSGRITWHGALLKLTGFLPEEFRPVDMKSWNALIHPDDRSDTMMTLEDALRESGPYQAEYRLRRKDGTYIHVEDHGVFLPDASGNAYRMLGSIGDITDRKKAEEDLRESEERYHSLFENSHAVMLLIEPESGRIVDANPAACSYYGYTREDITSRRITEFNTLSPEQVFAEMERARSLKRRSFVFKHRLADGEIRDVEVFSGPIVVTGKTLLYSIVHDITERRRAEEALKESEERFRSLIQNSADIIVILDANGCMSYETPSFSRVLGYSPGYMLGRNPLELVHPEDLERVAGELDYVFQDVDDRMPTEFRFRKADGSWILLEAIGSNLLDYPGIDGIVITARDITDRKKAEDLRLEMERRLLHAQRLESLGVMAGGIAHDFNNLLMAILGNLDLAQLDLSPVSRSRPFVDHALVAARRAADLTNQMLAYSGKGRFDLKTFDLSELVEEMSHLLRASISRTVTLNLQAAKDLPPIKADPGQIQQIVMNLIVNASEAIGDAPGVVTVITNSLECTEEYLKQSRLKEKPGPGRYVFLEVRDTGCGMDEETMDKLFDPFFTTKFTGRGLGLAAASGIITGHGGAVTVESKPGKGTSIRVLLPAAGESPAKGIGASGVDGPRASDRASPASPGGTILVVDDEEMVRDLCRSMVERLGFRVITASDGEEALGIFREHADSVVCVVLDLTMPKKDGMETFDELKRMDGKVKVILSSGFNEQEIAQRFLGKDLAGFIKKPYRLEVLRRELERVLGEG